MFRGWNPERPQTHEVNMTPLIDVSLVLVVMLLLATPLAFEASIGVRDTQRSARQAKVSDPSERIELVVISEDSVRVNRTLVGRDAVAAALAPLVAESTDKKVMVGCNHGVSHGAFVSALDQAKLSGAGEIAVFERTGR
jgi:biopolymer transport protein ExbD